MDSEDGAVASWREWAAKAGAKCAMALWVVVFGPFYIVCRSLGPACRWVGKSKAWRTWAVKKKLWVKRMDASRRVLARRRDLASLRLGRRWARRALEALGKAERAGAAPALRVRRRLLACAWTAAAVELCSLLVGCAALLVISPLLVAGIASMANEAFERFVAALELPWTAALWLAERAGAAGFAAGIVAKARPGGWGLRGGAWGANACVISQRRACAAGAGRRPGPGSPRLGESSGAAGGRELWSDPDLAIQALDRVGVLAFLLSQVEDGWEMLPATPRAQASLDAESEEWGGEDPRRGWMAWVDAMGEARELSDVSELSGMEPARDVAGGACGRPSGRRRL